MKNLWFVLLAVLVAVGVSGCARRGMYGGGMNGTCASAPGTCAPCGPGLHGAGCAGGGCAGGCLGGNGPGMGRANLLSATPYPYYTTRGPRDFLVSDPPPLGP